MRWPTHAHIQPGGSRPTGRSRPTDRPPSGARAPEVQGQAPIHAVDRLDDRSARPPHQFEVQVDGDLRGRGVWTLSPANGKVHVRFDWRVHADRGLLRILTPALRPLFRWNHNVAIERAMVGLEPYARAQQPPSR
jgi:hypothetical protein